MSLGKVCLRRCGPGKGIVTSESGVSSGRAFGLTAIMSQDEFLEVEHGGVWQE